MIGGDVMNVELIMQMIEPYLKDKSITYGQFEKIFDVLSLKEQYEVTNVLNTKGVLLQPDEEINVLDYEKEINIDYTFLNSNDNTEIEEGIEILYDKSIFEDKSIIHNEGKVYIEINRKIKQKNEILCMLIQEGNAMAKQDLCIKNERFVMVQANKYAGYFGHDLSTEDLFQSGIIGLIKAAERFDINKGFAFLTYAGWWVKQSISRAIMDNGFTIRVPVHVMEHITKITTLDNELSKTETYLNRRVEIIANELNMSCDKVMDFFVIRNNFLSCGSLDTPVGEEEETKLLELVKDDDVKNPEDIAIEASTREELLKILDTLTAREEKVLRLRFGLDDDRTRTLEQVGKEFNVTRERIRQIEAKALRKLRHPSRSKKIKDFLK